MSGLNGGELRVGVGAHEGIAVLFADDDDVRVGLKQVFAADTPGGQRLPHIMAAGNSDDFVDM